jgi:hypothetical protein
MVVEAVHHYHAAAAHALRLSAYGAGIAHLRRALGLLSTVPAGPDRDVRELELRLMIGTALTAARARRAPSSAASSR